MNDMVESYATGTRKPVAGLSAHPPTESSGVALRNMAVSAVGQPGGISSMPSSSKSGISITGGVTGTDVGKPLAEQGAGLAFRVFARGVVGALGVAAPLGVTARGGVRDRGVWALGVMTFGKGKFVSRIKAGGIP